MDHVAIIRSVQSDKEILGLIGSDRLKLTRELSFAKKYKNTDAIKADMVNLKMRYGNGIEVRVAQASSELNRDPEIHKFTTQIHMIIQHFDQNTIMVGPYQNETRVQYFIINNHTDLSVEVDFSNCYGKISGNINDRNIDGYGTGCAEYHDTHKLLSDLNDSLLGRILM